jgi:hypothetical protein
VPKLLRRLSTSQLERRTTALSHSALNASISQDGITSQSCDEQDASNEDHFDESDADCSSAGDETVLSRPHERDLGQLVDAWGTFEFCC